jgi:hypothetical protein
MAFVRAVGAILTLIIGLVAFAGGLFVAVSTLLVDGAALRPVDWGTVIGGAISMLAGVGFLWLSRAVGGEHGPVQSYRERPIKRRSV